MEPPFSSLPMQTSCFSELPLFLPECPHPFRSHLVINSHTLLPVGFYHTVFQLSGVAARICANNISVLGYKKKKKRKENCLNIHTLTTVHVCIPTNLY